MYCPKKVKYFYDICSKPLIDRFSEREESTRIEVISCFSALLKAHLVEKEVEDDSFGGFVKPKLLAMRSCTHLMDTYMEDLIEASKKQLQKKSVKTKLAIFSMLKQLSTTWKVPSKPPNSNKLSQVSCSRCYICSLLVLYIILAF